MDSLLASVHLLCNPYTGEPLRLEGETLVGQASGQRFPILNGIPSFVDSRHAPARHRFWRWFYDRVAFAYDPVMALGDRIHLAAEEQVRRNYIAGLAIKPGDLVLETAAGTAANIHYLPTFTDYYGVDISINMLRRAAGNPARWGRTANLFHADAQFLPFHDRSFDLVLQMGGLQFIADPFLALHEMARVAKPGARLHILDEISSLARLFKRLPAHASYARDRQSALEALPRLVPHAYRSTASLAVIPPGQFYALTFTVDGDENL